MSVPTIELVQRGQDALKDALGPIGYLRFMEQYESGQGDYTKEKYDCDCDDEPLDTILEGILKNRAL